MEIDYKIDIFQNEIKGFKGMKFIVYIFLIFFVCHGFFYLIDAYLKKSGWIRYAIAAFPFAVAINIYLQLKGRWIYKRYLTLNSTSISWTRSYILGKTLLNWDDINLIKFEYSSIKFGLSNGTTKNFNLTNITLYQIDELKLKLQQICATKDISYHSVS